jgi:DNA-binding response OmpR family regulator
MNSKKTTCLGRILIADDDEMILEVMGEYLSAEGYDCDCAQDATVAKRLLHENRYDLMISDVNMPGNYEMELVHQAEEIAREMPIILITGSPSIESAAAAVRLPVDAYLQKPFDLGELAAEVRTCIGSSNRCNATLDTEAQLDTSRKAIHEAIDVLSRTKRAFKSKLLGTLRQKLQVTIDELEAATCCNS